MKQLFRIPNKQLCAVTTALGFLSAIVVCGEEPTWYPTADTPDLSTLYDANVRPEPPVGPLALEPGPYLFVDEYLIADSQGVERVVNQPVRSDEVPNPIVTGGEEGDGNTAPYLSVIRDANTNKYRIWYNVLSNGQTGGFGTMDSRDGIAWNRPHQILENPGPITWGCSVLDDGPRGITGEERYKLCWWANGGSMLAASPDGLKWKLLSPEPVVYHNHDINSLHWDPIRSEYVLTMSSYTEGKTWPGTRRVTMQSTSTDLKSWAEPWFVLTPVSAVDEGETQFYAMEGYLARGKLMIGLAKILRDDVNAEGVPDGGYGIGYTTLAWSRDGRHWIRDTAHYFDPHPQIGVWDHTHAWIDEQVLVDDELRLYYGGYKNGHKYNRFVERQIGLVSVPRDRYVARSAGAEGGTLRTVPFALDVGELTVNAAVSGELRARLVDASGQPLQGFDFADCESITGDSLRHPLRWKSDLDAVSGQTAALEFQLRDAKLFAFDFAKSTSEAE